MNFAMFFPCWRCESFQHTTEPEVVKRQASQGAVLLR
nr:MAG TPA: hypothetical protein [Caudoviricetes sp.]